MSGLAFSLPKGACLVICGENGSGKSTLLDLLSGYREPLKGIIEIEGKKASSIRGELALLPQNIDYFLLGQTVEEELGLSAADVKDDQEGALSLASAWGFSSASRTRVDALSPGEKKRLALIGALSGRPRALFLDEPFSGLDWSGTVTLTGDLRRLKERGETVILSTHEPGLVGDVADYWLFVSKELAPFFTGDRKELESRFAEYKVRPF
ncbi:MAG: energy-coupling factor ABC transporter ATP-binding protein [Deltaproteobacteria bacterium]|nr:energy-coupling factor ABC transporter ATP-binding protein [Deltaproteobacteria bacterium]